jgi:hypothetical protein
MENHVGAINIVSFLEWNRLYIPIENAYNGRYQRSIKCRQQSRYYVWQSIAMEDKSNGTTVSGIPCQTRSQ